MKTLFLTLRTFSATGGIEKVCRIIGKALYEESIEKDELLQVCSMYDRQEDSFNNIYFPAENFMGYGVNRLKFFYDMVRRGSSFDRIILSHINLYPLDGSLRNCFRKRGLYCWRMVLKYGITLKQEKEKCCSNAILFLLLAALQE